MNVKSGATIDSIDLTFEVPAAPGGYPQEKHVHCGGAGGNANQTLKLDPDEYIVRIAGNYGNFVDTMFVQTSKGQMRNYGNKDSKAKGTFDYIAPQGTAITGLVIKSCQYVDALGVILQAQR